MKKEFNTLCLIGIALGFGLTAQTVMAVSDVDLGANIVACPMDARICPDGSSVGRIAPSCQFAACPAVENGSGDHDETEYTELDLASPEDTSENGDENESDTDSTEPEEGLNVIDNNDGPAVEPSGAGNGASDDEAVDIETDSGESNDTAEETEFLSEESTEKTELQKQLISVLQRLIQLLSMR